MFFFFQAEDGIRDLTVTGVQTCALPISITGHMVLSTLHVREATSVPVRLLDMGVPRYMVATALQAVIAQRLVRRVCERCGEAHEPTAQETRFLELEWSGQAGGVKQGAGCGE